MLSGTTTERALLLNLMLSRAAGGLASNHSLDKKLWTSCQLPEKPSQMRCIRTVTAFTMRSTARIGYDILSTRPTEQI